MYTYVCVCIYTHCRYIIYLSLYLSLSLYIYIYTKLMFNGFHLKRKSPHGNLKQEISRKRPVLNIPRTLAINN